MLSTYTATVEGNGRRAQWRMHHDDTCIADRNTFHVLNNGGCEPELAHLLLRVLKEGDTAVDVGANIGFFSLLMSRLVGGSGKVIAVEPGANNIEKLRQNVALNKIDNIRLETSASWSHEDVVPFYLSADGGRDACLPGDAVLTSVNARAQRLDLMLAPEEAEERIPTIVKIDIEGSEIQALHGAERLLDRVPYWVIELNHIALAKFNKTREDVRELMMQAGYSMFLLRRDGLFPTFVPHNVKLKSEIENLNVLFSTPDRVGEAWPEIEL